MKEYTVAYYHLDKPSPLKKGDKVNFKTLIGIMGGTPNYAPHLHIALCKGYFNVFPTLKNSIPYADENELNKFINYNLFNDNYKITTRFKTSLDNNYKDKNGKLIDTLGYDGAHPAIDCVSTNIKYPKTMIYWSRKDIIGTVLNVNYDSSRGHYILIHYVVNDIIGNPIERNENVNQLKVLINDLNIRDNANGNKLGFIKPGIYNYIETKEANNYVWYNLGFGWIAYNKEWVEILPKKEPVQEEFKPNQPNIQTEVETPQNEPKNDEITISDEQKTLIGKIIAYIIELIKSFLKG